MSEIFDVYLAAALATFAVLVFALIRNCWVYKNLVRLLWSDHAAYRRLPSYEYMLYGRFWVWRIEEFLR